VIEYKRRGAFGEWHEPNLTLTAPLIDRYNYLIRIDGVEQDTRTKEFVELFNKAQMWAKLRD